MKNYMVFRVMTVASVLIFLSIFLSMARPTFAEDRSRNPVRLALDLGDFLKALEKPKRQEQKETDNTREGESQEKCEPSRLERRLELLEGIGTLLSSTGEIDYESERKIGESLALEGFRRYGLPVKSISLQKYVNLVGMAVARNSLRPGLPYKFVVVDNPLQNAFSCPGGIIFICSGLFKTLKTEAQLASILAHEVAHVGHKHALQSIQRARFFQGVGKITATSMKGEKGRQFESMIGDLQTTLFDKGLDQNMEFEADLTAMETAYRTGYGPNGMVEVLKELQRLESRSARGGSWFSTHPPLYQRIDRSEDRLRFYADWRDLAQLPSRFYSYRKAIQ